MNALTLVKHPEAKNRFGKASVLNPDLCLGCGVCAFKCPTESLVLERRAEITEPPDNPGVFIGRFMADKANPLPRRKA
jgi:formate hydrogenlyase subunit 6/NADH:ubiquinone oxidoreductase subunit I